MRRPRIRVWTSCLGNGLLRFVGHPVSRPIWESGQPSRVPRPEAALEPGDHLALAKRQCTEWNWGNRRGHLGFPGLVEAGDLPGAQDPTFGSFHDSLSDRPGSSSQAAWQTVDSLGAPLSPGATNAEVRSGHAPPCPRTEANEPDEAGSLDTDEWMDSYF